MPQPINPGEVQIQPNSTGAMIDTAQVTQPSTGLTVQRQVMALGDSNVGANQATVNSLGELSTNDQQNREILQGILTELRIMNAILVQGFGVTDDLDQLRTDPYYNTFQG